MKKKRKIKRKIFFSVLLVIIVLLLVLLELQFSIVKKIFRQTEKIVVEEECSLILNNLVHKITDNSGCETICGYECQIIEKKFVESEFKENPGACNECSCYCR